MAARHPALLTHDHRDQRPLFSTAAVAGRHRLFHADAGRHHRQHRLAGDGAQPGRKPAAHAGGGGVVCTGDGHGDSGHGLAGRPIWHAARLHAGHRAVRPGLGRLRHVAHADRADRLAHPARHGRRHAAAGGAPDGAARLSAREVPGGDELRCHPGPDWAAGRAHAGRLAGAVRLLALDIPDQSARGRGGPVDHAALHARLSR